MDIQLSMVLDFVANATPGCTDVYGRTPLHYCASYLSFIGMEYLLPLWHFDVNAVDCLGQTALTMALQFYQTHTVYDVQSIVALLLQYGANPNIGVPSPLMTAVLHKDPILVELLLQFGANPNYKIQEESLFPVGSSAVSLCTVQPMESQPFSDRDLQILWKLIQKSDASTVFHAIQKISPSMKRIVMGLLAERSRI
jgi:ankyrin repeat protein